MKNYVKYSALVTTIALVAVLEGPANAIPEFSPEAAAVTNTQQLPTVVTTPTPKAKPTPAKPKATTKPAPKKAPATPAPAPVVPQSVPTPAPQALQAPVTAPNNVPAATTPTPVPAPVKPAPVAVKAAPVTPAPTPASGRGQAIAQAAKAQLGVTQDCTRLATNALAAVGINFHGWPAGYLGLGRTVSAAEAQPGDLAYYLNGGSGVAHIAVYIGNGQAVHGGWNGNQTSIQSVNVGSGPVFIRVA